MRTLSLKQFFAAALSIVVIGIVGQVRAAPPPLVGGETASTAVAAITTPTKLVASMAGGSLTLALSDVVGTDVKAKIITPTPVPDGSIVCMKANGRQSADWRAGHVLGKITTTPETCSWGRGIVVGGKVTMTVPACPADRKEAAAVMSGVVQLPDGTQAWIPHPQPYRVFNAKGNDATAVAFDCSANKVGALAPAQAKVMAKLY